MRVVEKKLFVFVAEEGVTHSPCYYIDILIRCSEDEYIAVWVDVNVIGIATRGCSVGKDSDELASQRKSGDVGKEFLYNCCVSLAGGGRASARWELSQHACLFRGYLWVNHRTSVLPTIIIIIIRVTAILILLKINRLNIYY